MVVTENVHYSYEGDDVYLKLCPMSCTCLPRNYAFITAINITFLNGRVCALNYSLPMSDYVPAC